ncbi:phage tail protein [Myxococcus landrumensis]|uniref:Phage tail protein n=1 Tax=Myxococcus landrumensis TaxID=2813577 RepID=A0ABX7N6F2_9BACT|nr:phage tail protein [Myxococcus landrumus]QSQ13006.1 phage tail protein [Myxococcus landrumus]
MAEAEAPEAASREQDSRARARVLADPFRAYPFKLRIDGIIEGHFTQCSGLEVEALGPLLRARGSESVPMVDMTLRHGVSQSPALWSWFLASMNGVSRCRDVSVLLLDGDGVTERLRWTLNVAWPKKWRAAPLDALGKRIAIDSLTLIFESLTRG